MALGWRNQFIERPWSEVRSFLDDVEGFPERGSYLFTIIDSVLDTGADELLAVTTSMHDLVIATRPVDEPPLDVVIVAAPGSLRSHPDHTVRIDHIAVNGKNTEIVRHEDEALPLFWLFLRTEFGISTSQHLVRSTPQ